jgi:hypothetical protein
LHGYDAARAIAARPQLFVTLEARDPTPAALVHDIRNHDFLYAFLRQDDGRS